MTWATTGRLIEEIRRKNPSKARAADHENSRRAAIHLFCLECVGGQRVLAAECTTYECPLWTFRPGASDPRPANSVPTIEEYDELVAKRTTVENRASSLQKWREAQNAAKTVDLDLAFEGIE